MINPWKTWFDSMLFAGEAQAVIALRMMRLAGGGALANAEAQRMVTEKLAAVAAAQAAAGLALATGQSPKVAMRRAMTPIRKRMRANRRRLGRARQP